jgi:pimeloyl-ACP methyl ester carboxylesterase
MEGGASGAPSAMALTGALADRVLPGVGHHLPHEAPRAFADAVLALVRDGKWRS